MPVAGCPSPPALIRLVEVLWLPPVSTTLCVVKLVEVAVPANAVGGNRYPPRKNTPKNKTKEKNAREKTAPNFLIFGGVVLSFTFFPFKFYFACLFPSRFLFLLRGTRNRPNNRGICPKIFPKQNLILWDIHRVFRTMKFSAKLRSEERRG